MLLVAVAIILVNALLMAFGPDARNVQVDYQLESWALGPILFDKARVYAAGVAIARDRSALFAFFRYARTGKAIRACADNHLGAKVVGPERQAPTTRSPSAWARPASRWPAA